MPQAEPRKVVSWGMSLGTPGKHGKARVVPGRSRAGALAGRGGGPRRGIRPGPAGRLPPGAQAYAIRELPVTLEIATSAPEVAVSHADPCDRIIIATAQVHNIPVMTSDHLIAECAESNVLW
ncbi:PIN domain-containing protein [Sorangium cellulosum]|uniref:PIN domain-containing protein n=1 Tax=Sorangium cellulosum TaxID=56 RepID=UPI003B8A78FF